MNCHDVRQHWSLYHDSEADAETSFQISEHLAMCPECAAWFARQSQLERSIQAQLGSSTATKPLWDRVLTDSGLAQPRPTRRRLLYAGAMICLVVAGFLGWPFLTPSAHADLVDLSSDWHEHLVDGQQPVDYRSESDLEVEAYLRQRVPFQVRCPPRKDAGFSVRGAGVCQLASHPVAYLQGAVEEAPVSVFILSRDSLASFPRQEQAILRDTTHGCTHGAYEMVMAVVDRNVVLVIGQTQRKKLERVLRAYGTYPEHPS